MIRNLKNQRFGRLVAICPTDRHQFRNIFWLCRCDCGNLKEVSSSHLFSDTKSCGCLRVEKGKKRATNNKLHLKHGDAVRGKEAKLYNVWKNIRQRCSNSNRPDYKYYGGKGIFVHDLWLNDYKCFRGWALQNGYDKHLTIDRINNGGNYVPENCQWITQAENTRKAHTGIKENK